jgi:hypothetical protein
MRFVASNRDTGVLDVRRRGGHSFSADRRISYFYVLCYLRLEYFFLLLAWDC